MSDSQRRALLWIALGLVGAAVWTVAPYGAALLFAVWTADLLQPGVRRLARLLGGRRRGAAAIVVLLLVGVLVPLGGLIAAVVTGVRDLLGQVRAAMEGQGTLAGILVGGAGASPRTFREWADLASRHGPDAWRALRVIARTSASALLGILVFVVTLYAFAASGACGYRWLARHSPLAPRALARIARAFRETGRGLIIGGGGTALVQGLVATVAYVALGIPRALLLGPLTALCAILPVVGTGLVWIPLAIELTATGDYFRAGMVVGVGAGVHSLVDNFVRPVLTKHGRLNLPTAVVLVSMLGGIAAFGASGALLGPLFVRLAVEALAIARDERVVLSSASGVAREAGTSQRESHTRVLTSLPAQSPRAERTAVQSKERG